MRGAAKFVNLTLLIATLGLVMVALRPYDFGATHAVFQPKSLAATGFIVLAAFALGECVKLLNVPALLGYILAGIVFGPNFLIALDAWDVIPRAPEALFPQNVITDLTLVNVLAVGVIGTMGGGELVLEDIKKNLRTILVCVPLIYVVALPATFVAVLWVARDAPWVLPFLDGRSMSHHYAVALLFAVFAAAMSPSVTLAILQETRAKGRYTSLVLSIVIVADLVLVACFLLALEFSEILLSPDGFSAEILLAELPKIAAEFGTAILLGIATGLVFIAFLRFVRREELFFTVAVIFVTSAISVQLHAETLLTFLTAGFIVQNFSKHGHDMIHALEKISLPVFVIYFMTQAAQLDLRAVVGAAAITLILATTRAVGHYVGATLGSDFTNQDATTRRYLGISFLSIGGVDLILAAKVGESALPWGVEFQTVIIACVVVHIIVGPPILKFALDATGQTERARRETEAEAQAFESLPVVEAATVGELFPTERFEDPELTERVEALRTILVDLHRDYISDPLKAKSEALAESLDEASRELAEALDALAGVLDSSEYETPQARADAVSSVHIRYLRDIADNVETWERIDPEIVHYERIEELVEAVRNREPFESVYRVASEAHHAQAAPGDQLGRRLVRGLRRVRRGLFGPATRVVPLGRLWRYHVELTITRYLAGAADAASILNERFWADLGNHMRRIDDLFDAVHDAVLDPEESGEETADAEPERPPRAQRILSEGRSAVLDREADINERLAVLAATAIDRYTVSLRETFANFVQAAELAGTYELPQWRYRPSALFDSARRAEVRIADRLRREHTIVTGHRGWIVAEWQLVLFLYWLSEYEASVRETLGSLVGAPIEGQLDVLGTLLDALPGELEGDARFRTTGELRDLVEEPDASGEPWPRVDWAAWLGEEMRPSMERARTNFQRMIGLYDKGFVTKRLLEPLERRVAMFSEEITLLSEHPDQLAADKEVPTLTIRLREWFESEVVRETALRLVEFDERGEAIVRTCLASLEDVLHVVEFNLLAAHRENANDNTFQALDVATGGLNNAGRMLDEMREAHERRFGQLTGWIVDEFTAIAEGASEPFLEHRQAEIERLMKRRGQATLAARGEHWAMTIVNAAASLIRVTVRRWWPVVEEVAEDVRSLFVEDVEPIRNADIRERLRPDERIAVTIPAIYRRLFTPLPLDIPDFYVARQGLQDDCTQAVSEWVDGRPTTILIYGDRGMGKRSTVQHLLQHSPRLAGLRAGHEIHSIVLDDDLSGEAELAHRIGLALPREAAETMAGLERFVERLDARHVIVIENGEKLFCRTDEGLDTARRFLDVMNDTCSTVLWIVLMQSPTVTYLDTAIGVLDYFTHAFEVGPLDADEIMAMIQRRHRVSGFRANFDRERPHLRDWIRRPIGTSEALRDPKAEFFRDLHRLSGGNPMVALLHWLEASRLDEADDHLLWLSTLPDSERDLLGSLSLEKRLILAALVQHGTLTAAQVRAILRRDLHEVQTELEHLQRLGFVREVLGRQVTAYRLRDIADALVTARLRDANMI